MTAPNPRRTNPASDLRPEGRRVLAARAEWDAAVEAAKTASAEAVRGGMSEAEAARLYGIGRMTVRVALGKGRPR